MTSIQSRDKEDDCNDVHDKDPLLEKSDQTNAGAKLGQNILKTAFVYLGVFCFGTTFAIPGPMLPFLRQNVEAQTKEISYIYPARSLGTITGCLVGGAIYDKFPDHDKVFMSTALFIMAISLAATPWIKNIVVLCTCMAINGITVGLINVSGNVIILKIWGKKSTPFIHGLHLLYAIGTVSSALIAAPFLSDETRENATSSSHDNLTTLIHTITDVAVNSETGNQSANNSMDSSNLILSFIPATDYYPFVIIAVIDLFCSISFACLHCFGAYDSADSRQTAGDSDRNLCFKICILTGMFFLNIFIVGIELSFGQYITVFSIDYHSLTPRDGALLASIFWGCFTATRLIATPLSMYPSPTALITISLVTSLGAAVGLVVFNLTNSSIVFTWILTGVFGAGGSTMFATNILWVEQYLRFTGKMATILVLGACIGEFVLPALIGFLYDLETVGPIAVMYVTLAITLSSCITFVLMLCRARGQKIAS